MNQKNDTAVVPLIVSVVISLAMWVVIIAGIIYLLAYIAQKFL